MSRYVPPAEHDQQAPMAEPVMVLPEPTTRMVRLGLIGVGRIATLAHLPAVDTLARRGWRIRVDAVCDADPARLAAAAERCPGAATFTDAHELIRQAEVDALVIMTWPPLTAALVDDAIQRGLPTLVEKPVSHDLAVLHRLADEAAEHGTPVQVAYNRLYQPLMANFQREVASIGPLQHIEARLWRAARREAIFYEDVTVHPISALHAAFGPLVVEGVTDWPDPDEPALPAGRRVEMRTGDGVSVHQDIRRAVGRYAESITALGASVSVCLRSSTAAGQGEDASLSAYRDGETQTLARLSREGEWGNYARGFVGQLAAFCRLASGDDPDARPDLRTAADIWRTADTIHRHAAGASR